MKTKVGSTIVDWEEMFNHSTSHREETAEFAEGNISAKEWVRRLWNKDSKAAANLMLKEFGVKRTRKRAKLWINRVCG